MSEVVEPRARRVLSTSDYDAAARVFEPALQHLVHRNRVRWRWEDGGRFLVYSVNDRGGERHVRVEVSTGRRMELAAAPEPSGPRAPDENVSPDGRLALVTRGHDLWVRDRGTGSERALTADGEPAFAYGKLFDDSTRTIGPRRASTPLPPFDCYWSPDSRVVFGHRSDEREVLPYPYVESVPLDGSHRPKLHPVRTTLLGEPGRLKQHAFAIDAASGHRTDVVQPSGWTLDTAPVGWSADCRRVYVLATADDRRGRALLEVDVESGAIREVIAERSEGSSHAYFSNVREYSRPNVRILGGGREALWFSQRSGRGRLYLYDATSGALQHELTTGAGVVLDLIHVDEARRRVYATLAGVEPDADPYLRQLYSIPLDGGEPLRLTAAAEDHEIEAPLAPFWAGLLTASAEHGAVSPDGRSFVDMASTLANPPVATLRRTTDGSAIVELERADASDAYEIGWRPPQRFRALAADGRTPLWGAIYLPPDYDPSRRYPVVDALYGGPQLAVAPRNFNEGGPLGNMPGRASLARLGFVVVTVDGRGTPGRETAFWEAGYGNFADPGLDDHVAVLRQLAKEYPGMDLNRVGCVGHSFGGYVASRALLRHPDFYSVGVASAGVYNWQGFRDAYEQYLGPVDYGDGQRCLPEPTAIPDRYRELDNGALAEHLRGKLLLAYGDLDENAPPSSTLQFVAALTRANRDYDLLYLPNRTHFFSFDPYFVRRTWDYFVEHLLGAVPPRGYVLESPPRSP